MPLVKGIHFPCMYVELCVSLHPCTDVCVHLCHLSYISLSCFCLREHNQVVLLQIKSVASLWPEICPHPLGNTYSSVLNASIHTHTHPYPYRGNCGRLYSDSSCSDVWGQQRNKNQLLPSSSSSSSSSFSSSSSSSSSSSLFLHLSFLLYSGVLLWLPLRPSLFLCLSTA